LAWLTAQAIGRQAILFVLFVALGRLLGPAEFGQVAVAAAMVALLQSVSSQVVAQIVVQRPEFGDREADVAFTVNLAFNAASAAALALAALIGAARGWVEPSLAAVIAALAATLPAAALYDVHQARLARDLRFAQVARKALYGQAAGGVAALALALAGAGVWCLVAQTWIGLLAELVVVRRWSRWRARLRADHALTRALLAQGAPLVGARLVSALDLRSPELALGLVAGQASAGVFRVARGLFDVVIALVGAPLRNMALPVLAAGRGDDARAGRAYLRMSAIGAWLLAAPFAALGVWGAELTTILFGSKWGASGWVLSVLAWQGAVYALFYLYEPLLVAMGRGWAALRLRLVQTGALLAAMACGAAWGWTGVVIAHTAGTLAAAPAMYRAVRAATGLRHAQFLRAYAPPILAASVFVAVALGVEAALPREPRLARAALAALSAGLAYLALFSLTADQDLRVAARGTLSRGLAAGGRALGRRRRG
jgi:PST family polysaccharide transporter